MISRMQALTILRQKPTISVEFVKLSDGNVVQIHNCTVVDYRPRTQTIKVFIHSSNQYRNIHLQSILKLNEQEVYE